MVPRSALIPHYRFRISIYKHPPLQSREQEMLQSLGREPGGLCPCSALNPEIASPKFLPRYRAEDRRCCQRGWGHRTVYAMIRIHLSRNFPPLQSREQEMVPEEVGKRAACALLSQIHAGGTVDQLHQVCPTLYSSQIGKEFGYTTSCCFWRQTTYITFFSYIICHIL
jgi:hypothetical protein